MMMRAFRIALLIASTFALGFIAGQVTDINLNRSGGGLTARVSDDHPHFVVVAAKRTLFHSRYEMALAPSGGRITLPYDPSNMPLVELTMMSRVTMADNRIHYSDDNGLEISYPLPPSIRNLQANSMNANNGPVGIVANAPNPQP